ncbi:MAG: VWA domain-containing protein [Planctomycetes bacterium]|nr:VWA domain-containing protein [Planctomycetota bacterium]
MRALRLALAVWLAALVIGTSWAAPPAKPTKPSDKERAQAINKLRSKTEATRHDGVLQLEAFKDPEAAKLLYQYGLHDPTERVRLAAYEVLMKFKDERPVCDWLVEQLNQESRRPTPNQYSPLLLSVLLSSDLAEVQQTSMRYLNDHLANARGGDLFIVSMIDLLGARGDAGDVVPLEKVAQSKLFNDFFVRRAVVQALVRIDRTEAVEALVKLVAKTDGEARADAMEYLGLVSGQKQLTEPDQWVQWWADNKATFKFPVPFMRPAIRKFENIVMRGTSDYYGLPLYAKKMVFVLDNSGSMSGPRIVAAKRELINAVTGLKDDVQFGIVIFNSGISTWHKELVPADTAHKIDASKYIERIIPSSATATYDAINAAFFYDAEAIYVLTDGAPTTGRYVLPDDIVAAVGKQNKTRRVSIYTIGIAPGEPESMMETFLRTLAEQNHGLYRRVDE